MEIGHFFIAFSKQRSRKPSCTQKKHSVVVITRTIQCIIAQSIASWHKHKAAVIIALFHLFSEIQSPFNSYDTILSTENEIVFSFEILHCQKWFTYEQNIYQIKTSLIIIPRWLSHDQNCTMNKLLYNFLHTILTHTLATKYRYTMQYYNFNTKHLGSKKVKMQHHKMISR